MVSFVRGCVSGWTNGCVHEMCVHARKKKGKEGYITQMYPRTASRVTLSRKGKNVVNGILKRAGKKKRRLRLVGREDADSFVVVRGKRATDREEQRKEEQSRRKKKVQVYNDV